ncbi:histamine H2 receptor-like [Saccoglossus kowalevskii]|uniref:Histamine H2 receptor-like n=1 Tax=Saccoglossus kowalevskii TaxID=10224 RepID=A0ABM0M628_SACKO|nr:PREDICTED: histamine H2 receptor-like [Saccoglossus kowalevskii]
MSRHMSDLTIDIQANYTLISPNVAAVSSSDNHSAVDGVNSPSGISSGNSRPIIIIALIGVILVAITIATILGNVLVCLAAVVNRKLRTVTNFFVVSLAVSDMLVGLLVLPFSAIYEIQRSWPFGVVLCNIWISMDVLLCTVSILNLFAISLDRYIAITRPMRYPSIMTTTKASVALVVIWSVSFLVSFLPIHMGWNTLDGNIENINDPTNCNFDVSNGTYVLIDGLGTFFLPLIIMLCTYFRIFRIAREQAKRISNLPKIDGSNTSRAVDEHKATKTLAVVMGAFTVCWMPYFTLFVMRPFIFSPGEDVNYDLYSVFLWMGYANSTLNPIVYTVLNQEFRNAFRDLLCHCVRTKRSQIKRCANEC